MQTLTYLTNNKTNIELTIPEWMAGVVSNKMLDEVELFRLANNLDLNKLVTTDDILEANGFDVKEVRKFVSRILGNAKGRSKNPQKSRGIKTYDLDEQWVYTILFQQDFKCPYSGVPYHFGVGKSWHGRAGDPRRPSINRLNPLQGYTQNNCEITSNWYNNQLMSWTHKEIAQFIPGFMNYLIAEGKYKKPTLWELIKNKLGCK